MATSHLQAQVPYTQIEFNLVHLLVMADFGRTVLNSDYTDISEAHKNYGNVFRNQPSQTLEGARTSGERWVLC